MAVSVTDVWSHGVAPPTVERDAWRCPLHIRTDAVGRVRARPLHAPSLVRLTRGLVKVRPDVVNVHFITSEALYFARLQRLFGYRLVLSAHGSDLLLPQMSWQGALPELLRRADAVTAVSEEVRRAVIREGGLSEDDVDVIPNGIDIEYWRPAQACQRKGTVAVGRLESVKGFDLLLHAFAGLSARGSRTSLTFIGDGPQHAALRDLADDLEIADRVEFTGRLDRDAVRRRLHAAELFVMPSRSEGLPLALLEAMACGLPVVATRVGGMPEVVGSDAGLCVEPEDPGALEQGMRRLLDDPEGAAALGRAALARAQDFSAEVVGRPFLALYERVLDTHPRQDTRR